MDYTILRTIWWTTTDHQWSIDHSLRNTTLQSIFYGELKFHKRGRIIKNI
jgi:hypothetical protein